MPSTAADRSAKTTSRPRRPRRPDASRAKRSWRTACASGATSRPLTDGASCSAAPVDSFAVGNGRRGAVAADPHRLDVAKGADALGAQFAPVARLLDPTERQLRIGRGHPVDEHRAGLDLLGKLLLLGRVLGPRVGTEAEVGGIGQLDGFAHARHPVNRGERSEYLLVTHPHVAGRARHHRGRVIPARTVDAAAAAQYRRALLYRVSDQRFEVSTTLLEREWP